MRGGVSLSGRARQLVDDFVGQVNLGDYLNRIGVYHDAKHRMRAMNGATTVVHTFERPHREVDVTSYGDAVPQTMVVSPGLHVEVEDAADGRETKILAAFLLADGLEAQLESERAHSAHLAAQNSARHAENERLKKDLLVFWDRMGKKARLTFAAKHPGVAERCAALEEGRERDRRAEAYDYDW